MRELRERSGRIASPAISRSSWLRAGGGNFGVVTSFDYRLHPVGPEVFFCYVLFSADRAVEVLRAAEQFVASEPSGFAPIAVFGRVPAVPEFPPDAHGQPFAALLGLYPGDPGEGERLLAPLRSIATPIGDLSGRMTYTQAQSMLDDDYPDGWYYYWKSVNLPGLSDDVIGRLATGAAAAPCPGPRSMSGSRGVPWRAPTGRAAPSATARCLT